MGIYRQGTKFTIREGKLTIFQKDKKDLNNIMVQISSQ